ncbi:MAG: hypothetical protein ACPG7F_08725, partial [Aggregatilineales bacterium]
MAQENSLERALNAGIEAVKRGENQNARRLLEAVIARDPDNELAWIWLASAVPAARERQVCLEKVLQINPDNERARAALNSIAGISTMSSDSAMRNLQRSAGTSGDDTDGNWIDTLLRIGIVLGGAFLIFIALQLFSPRPADIEPTPRPTRIPFTPTITPLPTRAVVLVTPNRDGTLLPPTLTPTYTPAPTETPVPTSTPFGLTDFTLLYTGQNEDETTSNLYEVRGDGADDRQILADVRDVSFNASGTAFVFVRDVACNAPGSNLSDPEATADPDAAGNDGTVSEVFRASVDNPGDAQQVTRLCTADAHSPILSPDGSQVIFVSAFNEADEELWLLDVDSGLTQQLTNNDFVDRDPDWSPDGRQVIFTSDRESPQFTEIYIMTLTDDRLKDDSLPATALTDDPANSFRPHWSPDGREIVYLNDRSGDSDMYVMTNRGQRNRLLITPENAEERLPGWTPDGRFVAFISNQNGTNF